MKRLLGILLFIALLGSGCLSRQALSASVNVSALADDSGQLINQAGALLNSSLAAINQSGTLADTASGIMNQSAALLNTTSQYINQSNVSGIMNASFIPVSNASAAANASIPGGSAEADCGSAITSQRTVVMGGAEGVSVWLYGPQLQPGLNFSTPFISFPVCSLGGAGQNPNDLYCQPVPVVGYPQAEGTGGCYILEINELAPGSGLPSGFTIPPSLEAYPQLYQSWQIVNVTCRKC